MIIRLLTAVLLGMPPGPPATTQESPEQGKTSQVVQELVRAGHVLELHRIADGYLRAGRYREAQASFLRALSVRPDDPTLTYGLCCALAQLGKTEEALAALQRSMELGYLDVRLAYSDPDLKPLRSKANIAEVLPEGWRTPQPGGKAWTFGSSTKDAVLLPGQPARFAHRLGDGSLQIRSCETGEPLAATGPAPAPLASLGASSDGAWIAALYANGDMNLIDSHTGEAKALEAATGLEPAYWTSRLTFAAQGSRIVAWTNSSPVLWSTSGSFQHPVTPKNRRGNGWRTCQITGSDWLPEIDGSTVHLHPLTSEERPDRSLNFPYDVRGVEFSPDGRLLAVGTDQGGVHLVEVESGMTLWSQVMTDSSTGSATDVFGFALKVPTLQFDPGGQRLAVCTTTGYFVGIFDVASGESLWRTGHLGGRMGGSMSLFQNDRLVVGDGGRLAWDVASGSGLLAEGVDWQKTYGDAFAALGMDLLYADDEGFHRINAQTRAVVWRIERPRRDPWLVEHPSGWFAGRFDASLEGVKPSQFDPKRLRLAERGLPLYPPPVRAPASSSVNEVSAEDRDQSR